MTVEFGRRLKAFVELDGRSLNSIAREAGRDQSFLSRATQGRRNFSPEMAILYAEVVRVGAPQSFIDESLTAIAQAEPPIEPSTFSQLLQTFLKNDGRTRTVIGGFAAVNTSYITRLAHGNRQASVGIAIALARELKIPKERLAEFVLLGRGFPPEIVFESLHAYYQHQQKLRAKQAVGFID